LRFRRHLRLKYTYVFRTYDTVTGYRNIGVKNHFQVSLFLSLTVYNFLVVSKPFCQKYLLMCCAYCSTYKKCNSTQYQKI